MTTPVTRRSILAAAVSLLSGCGAARGGNLAGSAGGDAAASACSLLPGEPVPEGDNPAFGRVEQRGALAVSSPAITAEGQLPNEYGHLFENRNPPLVVSGVPDAARSLALILDGPDAPGGEYTYWLVWNVPPDVGRIPAGWTPPDRAVQGANSLGGDEYGYAGPDPVDKQTFRFKLFALDGLLDLPRGADKRALGAAMAGHVVAATQLSFWYDFHTSAHTGMANNESHSNVLEELCGGGA
ncbi:MAG: YbhB/YbcL family Raf kinase inhibitor-like protein [Haloferacaceae archaeon]